MKSKRAPGSKPAFFDRNGREWTLQETDQGGSNRLVSLERKFLAEIPLAHLGVGRKLFRGAVL